jgi:hypothetical protein
MVILASPKRPPAEPPDLQLASSQRNRWTASTPRCEQNWELFYGTQTWVPHKNGFHKQKTGEYPKITENSKYGSQVGCNILRNTTRKNTSRLNKHDQRVWSHEPQWVSRPVGHDRLARIHQRSHRPAWFGLGNEDWGRDSARLHENLTVWIPLIYHLIYCLI